MKYFKYVLMVSSCLLSDIRAATCDLTDVQGVTRERTVYNEVFTMGFEAETSVFKVRPKEGQETYKMMIFKSPKEEPYMWAFTSDTLDNTLQRSKPPHWMNTECKTLGGQDEQNVLVSAERVHALWQLLLRLCPEDAAEVSISAVDIDSASLPIVWSDPSVEYDSIIVSKPNKAEYQQAHLVYPQLTYGLPLIQVKDLFAHMYERLQGTGHSLERFWIPTIEKTEQKALESLGEPQTEGVVSPSIEAVGISERDSAAKLLQKFMKKNRNPQAALVEKEKVRLAVQSMLTLPSSPSQGLALLFGYYVYCLFSNNIPADTDEPGPKPELGIMSRVSFSEMFDSLDDNNKIHFCELIQTHFQGMFNNKLVSYITLEGGKLPDTERITLLAWYTSITDQRRRNVISGKDLLYPPPLCHSLDNPYGMGAFSLHAQMHTLVEVRAYAVRNLRSQNVQVQIEMRRLGRR
jgi:hypothetical protein